MKRKRKVNERTREREKRRAVGVYRARITLEMGYERGEFSVRAYRTCPFNVYALHARVFVCVMLFIRANIFV